jgi:hypothetical protein
MPLERKDIEAQLAQVRSEKEQAGIVMQRCVGAEIVLANLLMKCDEPPPPKRKRAR